MVLYFLPLNVRFCFDLHSSDLSKQLHQVVFQISSGHRLKFVRSWSSKVIDIQCACAQCSLSFEDGMNSARGTRTVRLQRKASGFDFSVKGGREHGIPIVVSWVKQNGAAGEIKWAGLVHAHVVTCGTECSLFSEPGR